MNYISKRGRPKLTIVETTERHEQALQKLEPYLKSGMSIKKSLHEAKVPNSVFYRMMQNSIFWERTDRYKQYVSILLNSVFIKHLHYIAEKQNKGSVLNGEDISFLQWFAIHANVCHEEWGRHTEIDMFNPEEELQKMHDMISAEISAHSYLQKSVDTL